MAQIQSQRGNGTPVNLDAPERESRNWMRLAGIIGLLVFCAGVGGAVYAGGASMAEKATRRSVDAVERAADIRLDSLEQERAAMRAQLYAIDKKLDRIESKIDRVTP